MRNTKQKELILSIINNSYNHPTAYDIYIECMKVIPNISLGTVYRNLNILVDSNMIQRIKVSNVDRYDKSIEHIHFICIKCNSVIDIYDNLFDYKNCIKNNKVLNCKISLEGICQKCLEEEK